MHIRASCVLGLLLVLDMTPVAGQQAEVPATRRFRVTLPASTAGAQPLTFSGHLVRITGDTLRMRPDRMPPPFGITVWGYGLEGDTVLIERSRMSLLEVSDGRPDARAHLMKARAIGGLAGAVAGLAIGALTDCDRTGWFQGCLVSGSPIGGMLVFGAVGGVVGLIVGLNPPGERWRPAEP